MCNAHVHKHVHKYMCSAHACVHVHCTCTQACADFINIHCYEYTIRDITTQILSYEYAFHSTLSTHQKPFIVENFGVHSIY